MVDFGAYLEEKYRILSEHAAADTQRAGAEAYLNRTRANVLPQEVGSQANLLNQQAAQVSANAESERALKEAQGRLFDKQGGLLGAQTQGLSSQTNFLNSPASIGARSEQYFSRFGGGGLDLPPPLAEARGTSMIPGQGTGDKVPAMLTPKEAVLNVGGAEILGRDNIDRLNKLGMMKMGMSPDKKSPPGHHAKGDKWIQKSGVDKNKGGLHRALGVSEGKKIPASKVEAASHSSDPHLQHMAQFAKNVAHLAMGTEEIVPGYKSGSAYVGGGGSMGDMTANDKAATSRPEQGTTKFASELLHLMADHIGKGLLNPKAKLPHYKKGTAKVAARSNSTPKITSAPPAPPSPPVVSPPQTSAPMAPGAPAPVYPGAGLAQLLAGGMS